MVGWDDGDVDLTLWTCMRMLRYSVFVLLLLLQLQHTRPSFG
jgi:hypothetical protein